ncbi:MAG: decaprenyl-phosphate phosphoribosyltransferase [Chloroflexi bacterium HGW-Chloroflexi-9]|nr:MAG: decaprenyl-phosphate phosphoribosyltransferase [Chloroflexi bacterium HGW-Chloroflexi-9]
MDRRTAALWRAVRPLQWQKNLLLVAAAVFSVDEHWDASDAADWRRVAVRMLVGVLAFCAASSAVYLFNDVHDVDSDRAHPRKRDRPVASGALSPGFARRAAVLLTLAAIAVGLALGPAFVGVLLAYLALSAAYTAAFRAVAGVEAVAIAAGFGLRAAAGAAAIEVPVSGWLIGLSTLGALFVVWLKREQEIATLGEVAPIHRGVLRRYRPGFFAVAVPFTGWWIVGVFAAYAVRPDAPGQGALLLALLPVVLGLWRFAILARCAGARPVDELVVRDAPLFAAVAAFIVTSFVVLALGR